MTPFTVTQMIFNKLLLCFLKPRSGLKNSRKYLKWGNCLSSFSRGLKPLLYYPLNTSPLWDTLNMVTHCALCCTRSWLLCSCASTQAVRTEEMWLPRFYLLCSYPCLAPPAFLAENMPHSFCLRVLSWRGQEIDECWKLKAASGQHLDTQNG